MHGKGSRTSTAEVVCRGDDAFDEIYRALDTKDKTHDKVVEGGRFVDSEEAEGAGEA